MPLIYLLISIRSYTDKLVFQIIWLCQPISQKHGAQEIGNPNIFYIYNNPSNLS